MLGSLIKRGEKTWRLRYDMPTEDGEPRKQRSKTFRAVDRRDANDQATAFLAKQQADAYPDPGNRTLGDYLTTWKADKRKQGLSDTTVLRYENLIDNDIDEVLGKVQLRRLTPKWIKKAVQAWRERNCRGRKEGKLSDRSVKHLFDLLRNILNDAVIDGLLGRNPCDFVKPPKYVKAPPRHTDEEGVIALLNGLVDLGFWLLAVVKMMTGLRRGEILGLRWCEMNLAKGFLSVERVYSKSLKGGWRFVPRPKTDESLRTVAIPAFVVELLKRHKEVQQQGFAERRATWNESVPVFADKDGTLMTPDQLSSAFRWAVLSRNLPRIPLKGTRHSFATISIQGLETPLSLVSKLLGHSTLTLTSDTYSGILESAQREAAGRWDRRFSGDIVRPKSLS